MDLITLDRARQNLPASTNSDEPTIATLVTAASKAVVRYCRRDFNSTAYDEIYPGSGQPRLILRQYPILSVESVRTGLETVLRIENTASANQQARVAVTSTGLTLVRIASGVKTADTVSFAANPTLDALATAVAALGNGWQADVMSDFGPWPAADLRAVQGAFSATGTSAELQLHTKELTTFQCNERCGWLWRGGPADFLGDRLAWPADASFRIQYTAGYSTVPEDVQEATAQLTATFFKDLGRNQSFQTESVVSTHSYNAVRDTGRALPRSIRVLLAPYRYHGV